MGGGIRKKKKTCARGCSNFGSRSSQHKQGLLLFSAPQSVFSHHLLLFRPLSQFLPKRLALILDVNHALCFRTGRSAERKQCKKLGCFRSLRYCSMYHQQMKSFHLRDYRSAENVRWPLPRPPHQVTAATARHNRGLAAPVLHYGGGCVSDGTFLTFLHLPCTCDTGMLISQGT